MNTGIAQAQDPVAMAEAKNHATRAGRLAFLPTHLKNLRDGEQSAEGVSR
jgi:thiazole synthase ThiGH ThiG subunit